VLVFFVPDIMYKKHFLQQPLTSMAIRAQWVASIVEPDARPGRMIEFLVNRYLNAR
jgi:hypothetical protein